jgi:alpha-L-fucosidase 2
MDRALVWDLCTSYIEIAEAVGVTDGVEKVRDVLSRTGPPTLTPTTGRLLEWDRDYVENEAGHRHYSSMYGL